MTDLFSSATAASGGGMMGVIGMIGLGGPADGLPASNGADAGFLAVLSQQGNATNALLPPALPVGAGSLAPVAPVAPLDSGSADSGLTTIPAAPDGNADLPQTGNILPLPAKLLPPLAGLAARGPRADTSSEGTDPSAEAALASDLSPASTDTTAASLIDMAMVMPALVATSQTPPPAPAAPPVVQSSTAQMIAAQAAVTQTGAATAQQPQRPAAAIVQRGAPVVSSAAPLRADAAPAAPAPQGPAVTASVLTDGESAAPVDVTPAQPLHTAPAAPARAAAAASRPATPTGQTSSNPLVPHSTTDGTATQDHSTPIPQAVSAGTLADATPLSSTSGAATLQPVSATDNTGPDMAALVDRLVETRAAARTALAGTGTAAQLHTAISHAEFGRVSIALTQDEDHVSVSLRSADPDFAPTAQAALNRSGQTIAAAEGAAAGQNNGGQTGDQPRGQSNSQGQPQSSSGQHGTGLTGQGQGGNGQSQNPQGQPRQAAAPTIDPGRTAAASATAQDDSGIFA
ncbi:hypothetical protein GTZ99_13240 [Novosphingobium sp. FSY-8]|uniref:Flagellar hook-length control protein FliK n=1 Tax=Novosphingobium ovatum TaxID=1908523 RepID=A0ABW9XG40_9SPHN|nr:hypothetical protein [Novosphingobium ovatum]NBC37514.1 hypothetical protein [Novosphingobium ovatum]